MTRERWMALCFSVGSLCFLLGPIGLYAQAVGPAADGWTFFIGSIPFTMGGAIQTGIAWIDRDRSRGYILLRAALAQFVGTIFFNLTTLRGIAHLPSQHHYDTLVWRPDAIGSAAFLVSGAMTYAASPRRGLWPRTRRSGWWEPTVNLIGCVFFGLSALESVAISGSLLGPRIDAWGTGIGAVCFLACGVRTLVSASSFKSPRLAEWERQVEDDLSQAISAI